MVNEEDDWLTEVNDFQIALLKKSYPGKLRADDFRDKEFEKNHKILGRSNMGYLVVSRRLGESVMIGQDGEVKVTVEKIDGNQVRISITAPDEIPVNREEIHERIMGERK
jgi:carbon storage regulator